MSTEAQQLADEIKAVAERLNLEPSTVGERAGQGGKFYERMRSGKHRVWPETAKKVRKRLTEMLARAEDAA